VHLDAIPDETKHLDTVAIANNKVPACTLDSMCACDEPVHDGFDLIVAYFGGERPSVLRYSVI